MSRATVTTRRFNQLIREHHRGTAENNRLDELQSLFDEMSMGQKVLNITSLNLVRKHLGLDKIKFERSSRGAPPSVNRHLYAD